MKEKPASNEKADIYAQILESLAGIEKEMKRIGYWSDKPIEQEKIDAKKPFGLGAMGFHEWLQFVFIPNAGKIARKRGKLPEESMVGVQAMREYDYMDHVEEAQELCRLLSEFDRTINDWNTMQIEKKSKKTNKKAKN